MKTVLNSAKQQAISAAKSTARDLNNENEKFFESLKNQVSPMPDNNQSQDKTPKDGNVNKVDPEESRKKDQKRLGELEGEIKKISQDKLITDLTQKISRGETVYLNDYPNLPIEQKQVLLAQMEAYKNRVESQNQARVAETPSSKPSRKLGAKLKGMKGKLEDIGKRTEIRTPPSG